MRPPASAIWSRVTYIWSTTAELHSPPEALRRRSVTWQPQPISVMMDQSMLTAMTRAYFGAKFLGYNFKMVAIPDSVNIGKDPLAFDPKQMRAAFDAGRTMRRNPTIG